MSVRTYKKIIQHDIVDPLKTWISDQTNTLYAVEFENGYPEYRFVDTESNKAKALFKSLRIAFKKAEPYVSYLNPEVGHSANGPALPSFTDDTQRVLAPIGLQKIEQTIYEGGVSREVYQEEIRLTKGLLHVLKNNVEQRELNFQRFFIATHQQLLRIISLGITGFDTPICHF